MSTKKIIEDGFVSLSKRIERAHPVVRYALYLILVPFVIVPGVVFATLFLLSNAYEHPKLYAKIVLAAVPLIAIPFYLAITFPLWASIPTSIVFASVYAVVASNLLSTNDSYPK